VALLETSRPLPFLPGQLRVKKARVYEFVAAMREKDGSNRNSDQGVLRAAEAVSEAVYQAKPVPLTDDVRLPRDEVDELIAALRAAGA
jgi:predicted DNA-binding protein (UPF0278 family)